MLGIIHIYEVLSLNCFVQFPFSTLWSSVKVATELASDNDGRFDNVNKNHSGNRKLPH